MSGLKLAALYGLRPHLLGFCGPKEALTHRLLYKFLQGKLSHSQILPVIKKFKGALPYYQLIAEKNKIKNGSFNRKVIEAYWIGNELLEKVTVDDLQKMVIENFSGQGLLSKKEAIKKASLIREGSKPHHSFHVLVIGSVTGSVDFKNARLKDLCRISWGRIIKLKVKSLKLKVIKVIIEYQPFTGQKKIKLGKPIKKEIFWDRELVPKVKIGDWVSFHWNWLVQVLDKKDVENLKRYTQYTLESLI